MRPHRHSTRYSEAVILRQSSPRPSDSEDWADDLGRVASLREWTPLEPDFFEKKYYVLGVGPLGNPRDLALVDVQHS